MPKKEAVETLVKLLEPFSEDKIHDDATLVPTSPPAEEDAGANRLCRSFVSSDKTRCGGR